MIRYYLKQAIRSFRANKLIFGGSIITVSLGTLCISLLFSYVYNELAMNNFHHRKDDIFMTIYQATPESKWDGLNAATFLWFDYKKFPELERGFGLLKLGKDALKFTYNESVFSPQGIVADSLFFRTFDFKLRIGDPKTIMSDPEAIILSERFAKNLFGAENPIGKVIKSSVALEKIYIVKGIVENPPSNSSIDFDYVLSNKSTAIMSVRSYFLVTKPGIDKSALIKKIENTPSQNSMYTKGKMSLISLNDIYFGGITTDSGQVFSRFGDKDSLMVLYVVMAILLIISVLNFSNLQVININASIKNIGINKISGAKGYHIFYQKLAEIFLLILVSSVLITLSYMAVLPYFNNVAGVSLAPNPLIVLLLNLLILTVLVGFAMIYPAVVVWRIPIILSLKNQLFSTNNLWGRQTIVVVQFAFSIFLLIASIVVFRQLDMMLNRDLGFNSKNIVSTNLIHAIPYSGEYDARQQEEQEKNRQYVKNELESHSSVLSYTQGSYPFHSYPMPWKLKDNEAEFSTQNSYWVGDSTYFRLFGLKLIQGRFFDSNRDNIKTGSIIINEAALKYWGIKDISQTELLNGYFKCFNGGFRIVGVVKDFNYERLSYNPRPLIMQYSDNVSSNFLIQFKDGAIQSGLKFVQQLNSKINPGELFQYTFLSDEITALYQKEKRLSQIYMLFTFMALLISATGLFTIALYDTLKRTKEIGIRKVNGARVSELLTMLNKSFVKGVIIAFIIATPIAWYAMHIWLENFAYKTDLSWWIFALAGLLALGIAMLTVSWQSWRAATRNPVEALRYE